MRPLGMFGFLSIAAAACTTVWFVSALKPTTPGAFLFFSAWLVFPHVAMAAVLVLLERKRAATARWHLAAILVSVGGVLFLADVIFWHSDAQGALAVVTAPVLQGIALAVLLALSHVVSPRQRP